jgi:hypothetical protein
MKKFDLHTHTTFSDGTFSPKELIESAKEKELSGLSITDHDTIDAYYHLPKIDFLIGIGAEFSCFFKDESIHILGYDFHLDHPSIKALIQKHILRRKKRNLQILKNLKSFGIDISEEELYTTFTDRTVGRPHIAMLMIQKGHVVDMDRAFREYLAEGKKAYAQGEMISCEETIDAIHDAEGKAFIAHPHLIKRPKIFKALLNLKFDGIEAYYAKFPQSDVDRFLAICKEKKLLFSGGSDFHGQNKVFNQLGSSFVYEEIFHQIFSRPIKLEA